MCHCQKRRHKDKNGLFSVETGGETMKVAIEASSFDAALPKTAEFFKIRYKHHSESLWVPSNGR